MVTKGRRSSRYCTALALTRAKPGASADPRPQQVGVQVTGSRTGRDAELVAEGDVAALRDLLAAQDPRVLAILGHEGDESTQVPGQGAWNAQMLKKLKVYRGTNHPHEAQQPEAVEVAE